MKKLVIISVFLLTSAIIMLTGCSSDVSGSIAELISCSRSAELESGAEVRLDFAEDTARLEIESGEERTVIEGKYIADDESFVVFMPEIGQNYCFSYKPMGEELLLSYGEGSVILKNE